MFKFLKDKVKGALSKFSKKAEEAPEEVVEKEEVKIPKKKDIAKEEKKAEDELKKLEREKKKQAEEIKKREEALKKRKLEEKQRKEEEEKLRKEEEEQNRKAEEERRKAEEKKTFFGKLKERFSKKKEEEVIEEVRKEVEEKPEIVEKGFLQKVREKVTTKKISESKFEEMFEELEMGMLENNVAFEVIEKIKQDMRMDLVDKPIQRNEISKVIINTLRESIEELFDVEKIDLLEKIKEKKEKPFVVAFVGVNGSGKTTTIAKIANILLKNKISCLLVAGDTWRKAAIEQLEEHGKKLGIRVVKHDYGADPAAVAFDGIKSAKARNVDVVLIDTAGRQHSNINLMNEMEKIIRIAKPDLKIFIGESITGNDCIEQAKEFNEAVDYDGIILTKADVDEKGGAAVSVSYVTGKPIMYIGMGQRYDDLEEFNKRIILDNLGF